MMFLLSIFVAQSSDITTPHEKHCVWKTFNKQCKTIISQLFEHADKLVITWKQWDGLIKLLIKNIPDLVKKKKKGTGCSWDTPPSGSFFWSYCGSAQYDYDRSIECCKKCCLQFGCTKKPHSPKDSALCPTHAFISIPSVSRFFTLTRAKANYFLNRYDEVLKSSRCINIFAQNWSDSVVQLRKHICSLSVFLRAGHFNRYKNIFLQKCSLYKNVTELPISRIITAKCH